MKLKAFTLIEVLIIITVIATSMVLVFSWTNSALNSVQLQSTVEGLVGVIRHQQSAAFNASENEDTGIIFSSSEYTRFVGPDYSSSDSDSRVTFSLSPSIRISNISLNGGSNELIFGNNTGETDQYGQLTITNQKTSESMTILINTLGLVSW